MQFTILILLLITLTLVAGMLVGFYFAFLHPMMLENEKQTNTTLTMLTSARATSGKLDKIREGVAALSQAFKWDIDRCSNTHVMAEERSIILKARDKAEIGLFCQAINRGVKATDDSAYSMSVDFNNLMGQPENYGHLGFAFNLQDDNNYDFVYKR